MSPVHPIRSNPRPTPPVPLTPSQAISEARLALRRGDGESAAALIRGLAWDLDRLSREETERYADACAELGLLAEEVEARGRLVSLNRGDAANWRRLAVLHSRLGDGRSARRCGIQAPRCWAGRTRGRHRQTSGHRRAGPGRIGCLLLGGAAAGLLVWVLR